MQLRDRSLAAGAGLALVGVALVPTWGNAQTELTDKEAIVACMLEKTTAEDKALMRNFLIAALQEDDAGMQKNLDLMSDMLVDLAFKKCAMSATLLNENDFGAVAEDFGEKLGEVLVAAALDRLK